MPLFFGVAVFNFEGNGVILNLHANMENQGNFEKILVRTIILVIIILITFSVLCYEAFGN